MKTINEIGRETQLPVIVATSAAKRASKASLGWPSCCRLNLRRRGRSSIWASLVTPDRQWLLTRNWSEVAATSCGLHSPTPKGAASENQPGSFLETSFA